MASRLHRYVSPRLSRDGATNAHAFTHTAVQLVADDNFRSACARIDNCRWLLAWGRVHREKYPVLQKNIVSRKTLREEERNFSHADKSANDTHGMFLRKSSTNQM